jgi:hypothetical protein
VKATIFGRDRGVPEAAVREYRMAEKLGREVIAEVQNAKDAAASKELVSYRRHLARTLSNLAPVLLERGDKNVAKTLLKERIALDRALYEGDPGNHYWREFLAEGYYNLADALNERKQLNEPKEALPAARMAVTLSQERNVKHLRLYAELLHADKQTAEEARIRALINNDGEPSAASADPAAPAKASSDAPAKAKKTSSTSRKRKKN